MRLCTQYGGYGYCIRSSDVCIQIAAVSPHARGHCCPSLPIAEGVVQDHSLAAATQAFPVMQNLGLLEIWGESGGADCESATPRGGTNPVALQAVSAYPDLDLRCWWLSVEAAVGRDAMSCWLSRTLASSFLVEPSPRPKIYFLNSQSWLILFVSSSQADYSTAPCATRMTSAWPTNSAHYNAEEPIPTGFYRNEYAESVLQMKAPELSFAASNPLLGHLFCSERSSQASASTPETTLTDSEGAAFTTEWHETLATTFQCVDHENQSSEEQRRWRDQCLRGKAKSSAMHPIGDDSGSSGLSYDSAWTNGAANYTGSDHFQQSFVAASLDTSMIDIEPSHPHLGTFSDHRIDFLDIDRDEYDTATLLHRSSTQSWEDKERDLQYLPYSTDTDTISEFHSFHHEPGSFEPCFSALDADDKSRLTIKESWNSMHHSIESQTVSLTNECDSVTVLRCPHPSCSSKVLFTRQCDLDKHHRLHTRRYFCRVEGCGGPGSDRQQGGQSSPIGFATMKDRDRHEKGHSPSLPCCICGKLFARYDNLRDHCRRRHYDKEAR